MKKLLALLLAAALLLTCVGCGGKTDEPETADGVDTIDLSIAGLILNVPKEYNEAVGLMSTDTYALDSVDGISLYALSYLGMSEEEYYALTDSEESNDKYYQVLREPVVIICAEESFTTDEIAEAFAADEMVDIATDKMESIGSNEGYNYYLILDTDTSKDSELGDLAAEYRAICDKELTLSCITFVKPTPSRSEGKLSFETTDVYGNKVTSEELFAGNKVTMVNIWASWCGPCVGELPELEQLNAQFAEMGCGIIGILEDGGEEQGLADGLDIIKDTGVTYPVIIPWDSFSDDIIFTAYPTTYFVDSEGNILDVKPIVGAYVEKYPEQLKKALELVG